MNLALSIPAARSRCGVGLRASEIRANRRWNLWLAPLYNASVLRPRLGLRTSAAAPTSWRRVAALSVAAAVALAFAPAARADDAPPADSKTSTPERAKSSAGGKSGKKVISLDDDFLVEGQLDKPSAFYILKRSEADYDWARLGVELAPLVLESVQDPLF
jgi:hypothetical protein